MSGVLVVGAAVVDADRRLLAARRTAPPALAGLWELPGGKVEAGETPRDALVRELAEELGVAATLGRPVPGPLVDDRTPAGVWPLPSGVMAVWVATVADGVPAPLADHDRIAWVTPGADDCDALAWVDADRPIVAAVAALSA